MPRILVIWNPASGRARDAGLLKALLQSRSDTVLVETTSSRHATELARNAAQTGYELIIAAGGDGAVNAVANGLMGSAPHVAMGVLPIGTANDFAHTLALPVDFLEAMELLFTGTRRPIDLVEVETASHRKCFANVAAGGNSNRVTEALTDEIKRLWGELSYLRGAVGVLADLSSYETTIAFDDEPPFTVSLWNVLIANGRTNAGHLPVAPRARCNDGLFDAILIRDGAFVDLAALAAQFAFSGAYLDSEQVIFRQVHSLRIESSPPMKFSIDGEPLDEAPTAFRIKPAAVKMIVGPGFGS